MTRINIIMMMKDCTLVLGGYSAVIVVIVVLAVITVSTVIVALAVSVVLIVEAVVAEAVVAEVVVVEAVAVAEAAEAVAEEDKIKFVNKYGKPLHKVVGAFSDRHKGQIAIHRMVVMYFER